MKQKVSDYIADHIAEWGIRDVFTVTGGGAMHMNDAFGHYQHHEQACAMAAEAYARMDNRMAAVCVTTGPGATNAITGVLGGWMDSIPMLVFSGQARYATTVAASGLKLRSMGVQECNIVPVVTSITKYAQMIIHPEDIRYHLEKALYMAVNGRPGPVWLDIPLDVQGSLIDETALVGFTPEPPEQPVLPMAEIAALLKTAERPLLLAGNGVKLAGAAGRLVAWAEENRIPMLTSWKTIDLLDFNHPLNFGCPGIMGMRYSNFIVQNCDLLLVVGSRLDPSLTAFRSEDFGRNARKVMVDVDAAEIRKVRGIDLAVVADAAVFTDALAGLKLDLPARPEWLEYCRDLKRRYPVVLDEHRRRRDGVDLYAFTEELFRQLRPDDVIVPESSGAAGEVTYQAMAVKKGQKIRNAAGLGSMGFGLPYSIGACLANDRRRTVLINGDGAFQMNIQELETVVRLKLPVKMFIWDNDGYGSIMNTQRNMFDGFYVGSEPGSGLTLPDVVKLAAAYGIRAEEVDGNGGLAGAIARTLAGDDPVICKVKITRSHLTMPRVQAQKLPDGGMVSKPLEDMWPYLPAGEVARNMIAERV